MARQAARQATTESRHLRGIPLATKLALVMAGMIALFMVAFVVSARGFVRESVTEQILLAAHEEAFVASLTDLDAWGESFATPLQGKTARELEDLKPTLSPQEYSRLFYSEEIKARQDWNRKRFERFVRSDARIMAADLRAKGRDDFLGQSYEGRLTFTETRNGSRKAFARGQSVEGVLRVNNEDFHVIRGNHPVLSPDGEELADFSIYLRAEAVEEATSAFMLRLIVLAAVFVIVGASVAGFVGSRITRPIRQLQDDMLIVAGGDLEHRTDTQSRDEIGHLARSFDRMTGSLQEARQKERDAAASVHQMSVAGEVAASLFPTKLPAIPGFDVAGHHEASGTLGGEYYDVLALPGGRWGFLVGSASGRGLPAAMVMTMARSFLTAVARTESDPGAMLRQVNALLSADLRRGMYVTVLLAVLDPATGVLTVANAGHSPLLLWKHEGGGTLEPVHSEGIALGFDKGPVFDRTLKVVRLTLAAGDRVVLYTPGITRVTGAEGDALGEERFAALVRREGTHPAALLMRRMAALVKKYRGDQPLTEDVTLLTLGRLGGQEGSA